MIVFHQAVRHSKLALEAEDVQSRAEASLILASVLKDLGQLDKAEDVRNTNVMKKNCPGCMYNIGDLFALPLPCYLILQT